MEKFKVNGCNLLNRDLTPKKPRKDRTQKQIDASTRNFDKRRVSGALANLENIRHSKHISNQLNHEISLAIYHLERTLKNWDVVPYV